MAKLFKIAPNDNVVVALQPLQKGDKVEIEGQSIVMLNTVDKAHKVALKDISEGEQIIKYGFPIAYASTAIKCGEHVHTHNIKTNLADTLEYKYEPSFTLLPEGLSKKTFWGFQRKNGEVGIRNELWIVPTVGCVNGQANMIAKQFAKKHPEAADLIQVFGHNYGCSQLGDDHENTKTALCDLIKHPNGGGVLVLGLGCENNQIDGVKAGLGDYDSERIHFLNSQDVEDEIEEGLKSVEALYALLSQDKRVECPLKDLNIGLKCGGSDGFSGITANPLLGVFSVFLIAYGGSTILTEVPEMFGAEHLLMERAMNEGVFDKTVAMINGFKEYFIDHNQPIYENPSPGNKAGGITTLEDKSLGCTQKGGTAPVVDVLAYGERLKTKGLNLLYSPGNDLVASSALGFSGCQMVLFTTGRGTPFGSFVPTMKISTNSDLA
nr:altronate dehydratase family protein [Bacteroidales bacterium]